MTDNLDDVLIQAYNSMGFKKYDENEITDFNEDPNYYKLLRMLQFGAWKLYPGTWGNSTVIVDMNQLNNSNHRNTIILRNIFYTLFKNIEAGKKNFPSTLQALDVDAKKTKYLFSFASEDSVVQNDWTLMTLFIVNIMKFFYCEKLESIIYIDFTDEDEDHTYKVSAELAPDWRLAKELQKKFMKDVNCVNLYTLQGETIFSKIVITKTHDNGLLRVYQMAFQYTEDRNVYETQQYRIDKTIHILNDEKEEEEEDASRIDLVETMIDETLTTSSLMFGKDDEIKYLRAIKLLQKNEIDDAQTKDNLTFTKTESIVKKTFFWRVIYHEVNILAEKLKPLVVQYKGLLLDENTKEKNSKDLLDYIATIIGDNKLRLLSVYLCDPTTQHYAIKKSQNLTFYQIFVRIAESICGISISTIENELFFHLIQKQIGDQKIVLKKKERKIVDNENDVNVEVQYLEYDIFPNSDEFWSMFSNDHFMQNFEKFFNKTMEALQQFDNLKEYKVSLKKFKLPQEKFQVLQTYLQDGAGKGLNISSFQKVPKEDTWAYKFSLCDNQYLKQQKFTQKMNNFLQDLHQTFNYTFLMTLKMLKLSKISFKAVFTKVNFQPDDTRILLGAIETKESWEIDKELHTEKVVKKKLTFSKMDNDVQDKDEFFKFIILSWLSVNQMVELIKTACKVYDENYNMLTQDLFTKIQESTKKIAETIKKKNLKREQPLDSAFFNLVTSQKKLKLDEDEDDQTSFFGSLVGGLVNMSKEMENLKVEVRRQLV